jgi:tetratricopeptide (TPR) repeat protein
VLSLELLSQGKIDDARAHAERGFGADSSDPLNRFALARITTDAKRACDLYRTVAVDEAAADSIRAAAYGSLAQELYVGGDYDAAAVLFAKAVAFDTRYRYRHAHALALLGGGDTAGAEAIWVALADEGEEAGELQLGVLLHERGHYRQAYESLHRAAGSADPSIAAPAMAMAASAARKMGDSDRAAAHAAKVAKRYPFVLEGDVAAALQGSDAPAEAATNAGAGERYTIQVGAFGSAENASRLRTELGETFGTVNVVKERSGMRVLHKVRIGSFGTEREALDYGERMIGPRGMSFRVVEK